MRRAQKSDGWSSSAGALQISALRMNSASFSESRFSVTQSSVSRDLDELGIIKANGFYAIPQKDKIENVGLQTLEIAGENLIVAKCESGLASAVCVKIDREKIEEIVGTIAGDDTIFIAVKDAKMQKVTLKKIWEVLKKNGKEN